MIAHAEIPEYVEILNSQIKNVRDGIDYAGFELQCAEYDFSMCTEQLVDEMVRVHSHLLTHSIDASVHKTSKDRRLDVVCRRRPCMYA